MKRLFRHKKVLFLTCFTCFVIAGIALMSIMLLFDKAEKELYSHLTDIVNREKTSIKIWTEIYKADEKKLIEHFERVRKNNRFGINGELAIAKKQNDSIFFIVSGDSHERLIKLPDDVNLAQPMKAAFSKKSGQMKALDYKGDEVYAVYSYSENFDWVIVAKLPAKELKYTYLTVALVLFLISLILTFLLIFIQTRVTNPLIDKLLNNETELIIEKKKAQAGEKRIRTLFSLANVGIFSFDGYGKIIDFNETFLKYFGYTSSEMKMKNYYDFFPKEQLENCKKIFNEFTHKKISDFRAEILFQKNDSSLFWGDLYLTYVGLDSDNYQFVGALNDIDKRRKIEETIKKQNIELLRTKERAEDSDKLKTNFLQNLSHEIRTPMNVIFGYTQMLKKKNISEEKINKYSDIIVESSKQLLSIITDILTISSIDLHQEKIYPEKVDIELVLTEIITEFQKTKSKNGVELRFKNSVNRQTRVFYTDKSKFYKIIHNFMDNSFKFTETGYIEIGYKTEEESIEFYVKDTGIGIKPEYQNIIFEHFRQADSSINRKYTGNGLGLSIAKGYADLLGAEIRLESEVDKGSVFYLIHPNIHYNKTEVIQSKILSKNKDFFTILIADDVETNLYLIDEILSENHYELLHAHNGKEAFEICKHNYFIDLVLMDIKMPEQDGATAAKLIKELRPGLPIIAQTAYVSGLDFDSLNISGFDDIISKPLHSEQLKNIIDKYLKKSSE